MTETLAVVRCVECSRRQQSDEFWQLRFADIGEVAIYCPACAEREFGGD
jgi:predicted metal-binding protein